MGLFEKILGNRPKPPEHSYGGSFEMLDGYVPHFTTRGGELYESELVRAAINTLAVHISKLKIETKGAARPALQTKLKHGPNQWQTWSQFLERAATLYYTTNNLLICPVYDEFGEPSGVYALRSNRCEIVQYKIKGVEVPFIRYVFGWGKKASVPLEDCAIIPRMQYKDDFFGESNAALVPTMDLIDIQNQGIKEGVKSAASYRFMAQASNFSKPGDLKKERKRFSTTNLSRDAEGGGLLLFPNTYTNIQQIKSSPYVVDADQMKLINDNVNKYFGVNEDIMTNHFSSETWSAFYEGAIEPFAVKLSDGLTKMLFTEREQTNGNLVIATANRLQYMSNADKLNVSAQMADRGLMTRNEIREIWNLAPLPEPYGSQLPIRGEYYTVNGGNENESEKGNQDV